MPLSNRDWLRAKKYLFTDNTPICTVLREQDNPELIKYLVDSGSEIHYHFFPGVNGSSSTEFRPLTVAAIYKRYYSLLVLLNAGANVNLHTKKNNCGLLLDILRWPRVVANKDSIIRLFLYFGADPNAKNGVDGEDGTFYQFIEEKQYYEYLDLFRDIHSQVQQIQTCQQQLQVFLQTNEYKKVAERCETIASLLRDNIQQETVSPFKEYYVSQAINYLSHAAQYTENVFDFTELVLQIKDLSLKLKGEDFFYSELQKSLLRISSKIAHIERHETENLQKIYDAFASIYGVLGEIQESRDFAAKAAQLMIPQKRKINVGSSSSSDDDVLESTPLLATICDFSNSQSGPSKATREAYCSFHHHHQDELIHRVPHSQRQSGTKELESTGKGMSFL